MNDRARRIDAHRPSFRALGKPGGRRRVRPARDRFAFVPGNGLNTPERLELRQMLDGSGDLTRLISTTLSNGVDGTYDLDTTFGVSSIKLGDFLTAPDATVTLSGVSHEADGGYTATVAVDVVSASLNIGTVSGSIAATGQDTVGLHGSYSLADQSPDQGSYALDISDLTVTVPGALKAEAQGVNLAYSPSVTTSQTLLTLGSASGTLLPLNNATFMLKNLAVRTDGFSIGDGTVTADEFSLGKVIDVTHPTLAFSGVAYTVGSPLTGTITASAASAKLFPGNSTLTASVTNFSGAYTLGASELTLSATSADLKVGKILEASATKIGLTWDGTSATVDLDTATLSSPLLPGVQASVADFHGDNTGFSVGQADLIADEVKLGDAIDIKGVDLGVSNLTYATAANGVGGTFTSGTFTIGTQSASLFPGNTELTSSITGLAATYTLGTQAFGLTATSADLKVGKILEASATKIGLTWDGTSATVDLDTATLSSPLLPGVQASVADFHGDNTGFSVGQADLIADEVKLGDAIDIKGVDLGVSNLTYATAANGVGGTFTSGTFTIGTQSASLFPGNTELTSSITGLAATYTLGTQAFGLTATSADLQVTSIFKAHSTAISLKWDGTNASVDLGTATFSSPLLPGAELDGSDISGDNTGFSIGQADLTASEVKLGGVIDIKGLDLGVTNLAYRTAANGVGGTFTSGTFTIGTQSASLFPGNTELTSSITGLSATYTLGTQNFALLASSADLKVGKILDASATDVALKWDGTNATVDLGSATLTSPLLPGVQASVADFHGDNTGFSVGQADLIADEVKLGDAIDIKGVDLGVSNLTYATAANGVGGTFTSGTFTIGTQSASLFPGNTELTSSITGLAATYTLGTQAFGLTATSADLQVTSIFKAHSTAISLKWDGTNASVDLGTATFSSPLLAGVQLDGSDISGDNTGFSIGQADLKAAEVNLGGVLDITNLDLGVTGLSYDINSKALGGTFTITAGVVSILPNATAFTSSVTGFGATYALASDTLTVKADSASITLGTTLNVTANVLGFTLTPTTNLVTGHPDDNVTVTVGSATASLPQEDVSGSITGLTITNDGFHLASATLTDTSSAPFSLFGGKFSVTQPSVSLTNFGYSLSAGAEFNSDLTLMATEIDFNPTSSVSIAATGVTATISFTTSSIGHFTFSADTVNAHFGSFLAPGASQIAFDTTAADGYYVKVTGTVTAAVNAGPLSVTGSAGGFEVDANDQFVTLPGFAVSLNLSDSTQIKWPTFLPIQISHLGIAWPNNDFATNPTDFVLDLSASINAKIGSSGVMISGSVTDAMIDVGLLQQGKFPITGLSGAGLAVSGTLFGATVSGGAFLDILNVDANGVAIASGSSTPIANRIFYGGIEAGIELENAAGFQVRLGFSQLGPLDAFLEVGAHDPARPRLRPGRDEPLRGDRLRPVVALLDHRSQATGHQPRVHPANVAVAVRLGGPARRPGRRPGPGQRERDVAVLRADHHLGRGDLLRRVRHGQRLQSRRQRRHRHHG